MFSCLRLYHMRLVRGFTRNSKSSKWPALKNSEGIRTECELMNTRLGLISLVKPFIFTVTFSGSCFVGASIWQYENMRKQMNRFAKSSLFSDLYLPKYKRGEIRRQISSWWNTQSEGQKIVLSIIGINCCVFLLWRVPLFHPIMNKYFCANPTVGPTCLPLLLSTFSHYSFFHMAANMYVLYSFSNSAVAFFGKEQFLALYLSAGVVSSFTSYAYKVFSGRLVTSLGASGALMAVLSSMCFQFPDSSMQIIFFPFFTFSAGSAIKAIMALDLVGLVAKWKLFDHAAHLGGAIYGIIYLNYGREYVWDKREKLFLWYHSIREGKE